MTAQSKLISTKHFLQKAIIFVVSILILYFLYGWGTTYIESQDFGKEVPLISSINPFLDSDKIFEDIQLETILPIISIANDSKVTFSIRDEFSNFPNSVFVYEVGKQQQTFLTVSKAEETAKSLGFTNKYIKKNKDTLFWKDENNRNLTFNSNLQNWELNSLNSTVNVSGILEELNTEELDQRILNSIKVSGFGLDQYSNESIAFYPVEYNSNYPYQYKVIDNSVSQTYLATLYPYLNSSAISADGNKSAQEFITENEINLESKLVGENPFLSNFFVVVDITQEGNLGIRKLVYKPTLIRDAIGVYPLVTVEEAYERLQEGKGFLRSIYSDPQEKISEPKKYGIKEFIVEGPKTELAYYIKDSKDEYTYPVFIFSGLATTTNNEQVEFVFYVDALEH